MISPIAIQVSQATKLYAQGKVTVKALDNVSLTVPVGHFIAIMGASGSGKSTLLHLIAGLAQPTSGEVALFGEPINKLSDDALTIFRRRKIGMLRAMQQIMGIRFSFEVGEVAIGVFLMVIVALLSVWMPARTAARTNILEAMRYE